jgi:hypothetical protein
VCGGRGRVGLTGRGSFLSSATDSTLCSSKVSEKTLNREKKNVIKKKILKMKYRFVWLELLDYLKHNLKKKPKT